MHIPSMILKGLPLVRAAGRTIFLHRVLQICSGYLLIVIRFIHKLLTVD